MKPSLIGLTLRDTYAVPSVKAVTGKSITSILKDKKLLFDIPEDLQALHNRHKAIKKHLENNSRDTHNKRGLILIESKLRRMVKYYKSRGRIPSNWSYN